jgi:L-ascorbate metabolism protein UlaG (beta-lactamase superfamily)
MGDEVYLRSDVQLEPLVDQWYAWSHLIPPATSSRNLTERHIRIMQSYISAPLVHAKAVQNPKMLGGPFIDYGGRRVDEIARLLAGTINARANLLSLSKAIDDLDRMLTVEAKGESLQRLYSLVPAALKGYVELIYDRNSNASFRLVEPLIYLSDFYSKRAQRIALSHTKGDSRPFILSTPRLPNRDVLELDLPFEHEAIDLLCSSKRKPTSFRELLERCGVSPADENLFRSFFTLRQPKPYLPYRGQGVRWRYFGHACILLETSGLSCVFDPVLSYTYESDISRYTYDDLPNWIDYVFITHNHQDHVLLETMLQLRHKTGCIVVPRSGGGALEDPSLKLILENVGFRSVRELDELQSIEVEGGTVSGIPFMGEHADLNIRTKLAYLLDLNGSKLLFAADSCNIEPLLYSHLYRHVGDIRALFVGMECHGAPLTWLYGPLLTRRPDRSADESRRLSGSNFTQAIEIVSAMNCKEVFVYAMGQEPWLNYIMSIKYSPESAPIVESDKLIATCRQRGLLAERLFGEREMHLDPLITHTVQ